MPRRDAPRAWVGRPQPAPLRRTNLQAHVLEVDGVEPLLGREIDTIERHEIIGQRAALHRC